MGQASSAEAVVSLSGLYNKLGQRLVNERSVMLLYLLLHGCQTFQVGGLQLAISFTVIAHPH